MKILNLFLFAGALLFAAACSNGPKGEAAEVNNASTANTEAGTSVAVNTSNSEMKWAGSKISETHSGTIKLKDGSLSIKDNKVVGGSFNVDMSTMVNTDMPADKGGLKLVGHLASADFFDVETYPTAKFEITKVTGLENNESANSMVYGNLTLKDVTKEIGFKANINVSGGAVEVTTPDFTIDRTDFGIKYGSGRFFDIAKDKAIKDKIGLSINLTAG